MRDLEESSRGGNGGVSCYLDWAGKDKIATLTIDTVVDQQTLGAMFLAATLRDRHTGWLGGGGAAWEPTNQRVEKWPPWWIYGVFFSLQSAVAVAVAAAERCRCLD